MVIDAYSENIAVFNIFYRLDIASGQTVNLILTDPGPVPVEVFHKNDPALEISETDGAIKVVTKAEGTALIRIMTKGDSPTILRDILINVVPSVQPPATSLNASFGSAQPK